MQNDPLLPEEEQEEDESRIKVWLEENLRIILSVLVVLAIAGGIYSYSQRSQAPALTEVTEDQQQDTSDLSMSDDDQSSAIEKEDSDQSMTEDSAAATSTNDTTTPSSDSSSTSSTSTETASAPSQETTDSFIETAIKGDSATRLARRALADYLEKNPDSSLSKEHKIYIEDYLRKHVGHQGPVRVGTSVGFSKSLIQEAIGKSKQLNERQLANLTKYAARVSSL